MHLSIRSVASCFLLEIHEENPALYLVIKGNTRGPPKRALRTVVSFMC